MWDKINSFMWVLLFHSVHDKNNSFLLVVNFQQIVPPVLDSFSDQDSRVRYYACEALYNIAKVSVNQLLLFITLFAWLYFYSCIQLWGVNHFKTLCRL